MQIVTSKAIMNVKFAKDVFQRMFFKVIKLTSDLTTSQEFTPMINHQIQKYSRNVWTKCLHLGEIHYM